MRRLITLILVVLAALAASQSATGASALVGECRVYPSIAPFYYQFADQVKATSTTSCTTNVWQRPHIALEVYNPLLGHYVVAAINSGGGFIFTKTRAVTVSDPCNNTFTTRYKWRSASWMEVIVNGITYRSSTVFSTVSSLYCKP